MTVKVDLLSLTAQELQGLLSCGAVTSSEITARFLDQIEKHNHAGLRLIAIISTAPRERVLAYAKKLDEERQRGVTRGPFHGVPIIVKDAYSTPDLGMPTTCGSFALIDARAKANATVIDKLLAAGTIILAKANMSEWGNMKGYNVMAGWSAVGGQTQSPYVERGVVPNATFFTHTGPAGSSSGSAVGVAAGFAPLSLGTESDGSINMPACRAGLYSLKITRETVDDTGVQPALREFDCLGGFAKRVTDLARLVAIMQGRDTETYLPLATSWEGIKVGFVDPSKWRAPPSAIEPVEEFVEQTEAAMFAAQKKIIGSGGKVVKSIPLLSFEEIQTAMPDMKLMEDLNPYQFRQCLNSWLAYFDGGPKTIEELIEFNKTNADEEFTERDNNQSFLEAARDCKTTKDEFERNLKALRDKASESVRSVLKEYDVDVIVGPCDSRTNSTGSAAGFPTANLPLGFANFNGRGFGLHMIAPRHEEAVMLRVMAAWEATFPENVQPPRQLVNYNS